MSDQGKANYEAYRKLAGRPGVSAAPLPEYEQLPMELASAFDAGAYAVELWLSQAPVDEDAPGNEPQPERDRLLALVDKATRDHADVGIPSEVRRANANRAEAGLDLLPVPGEDGESDEDAQRAADLQAHVSGMGGPSPAWVTDNTAGVAAEKADDFVQDRHADLDAGENGGAMTDADFYDRTVQHEDGDYDSCEPTL
jgi:hypothetical protein